MAELSVGQRPEMVQDSGSRAAPRFADSCLYSGAAPCGGSCVSTGGGAAGGAEAFDVSAVDGLDADGVSAAADGSEVVVVAVDAGGASAGAAALDAAGSSVAPVGDSVVVAPPWAVTGSVAGGGFSSVLFETLAELDALRDAFALVFVAVWTSFGAGDFLGATSGAGGCVAAVVSVEISLPLSGNVEAGARGALASATVVWGFTPAAARTGFAMSWLDVTWSSTSAPPIAIATITPNAIPKCFTGFSWW